MKCVPIVVFLFVLLAASVCGVGLAIPPNKEYKSFIGDSVSIAIQVINQENRPEEYKIFFEGDLKDKAKAVPDVIYIDNNYKPTGLAIESSQITVNSTGILPGRYNLVIGVELGGKGGIAIVQQVKRTIYISYEYPPSMFSKIMNFVVLKTKALFSWVVKSLKTFYRNNKWINYLFVFILLCIFFYAGTRTKKIVSFLKVIAKKLKKEKERISNIGFKNWMKFKIKHTFKKLKNRLNKSDIKHEEKEIITKH